MSAYVEEAEAEQNMGKRRGYVKLQMSFELEFAAMRVVVRNFGGNILMEMLALRVRH